MKILFSTGFLNGKPDANTKIVYSAACALAQRGHSVILAGENIDGGENAFFSGKSGVSARIITIGKAVKKSNALLEKYVEEKAQKGKSRQQAVKSFCIRHPFMAAVQMYRHSPMFTSDKRMGKYRAEIKAISDEIKPDAVICVYSPFNYAYPVIKISDSLHCPIYLWQLDPWGLHRLDISPPLTRRQRIEQETEAFGKARHIFTTGILKKLYGEHELYAEYADKITVAEFPNVTTENTDSAGKNPFVFSPEDINLVYCGMISDIYRSPKALLENICACFDDIPNLKLWFAGDILSDSLEKIKAKYPGRIFTYAKVSPPQAFGALLEADCLINIGNNLDNQVPSKIFDYFATGKPIITTEKIENCPAREYMDRYPLSFTIKEWSDDNNIRRLKEFILNCKGKKLDYEQVKKLFYSCTPEYVARQIEKVLSQ